MKSLGFTDRKWQQKLLWCAVVAMAASLLAFSLFELFSLSATHIGALAGSIFVALLVCPFKIRLPQTGSEFATRHVFSFWGIMWIGVPGGVLLGTAASAATLGWTAADRREWLGRVSIDTVTTFVSAIAYYLTLGLFSGSTTTVIGAGFSIPNEIIGAATAMALVHFLQYGLLNYTGRTSKDEPNTDGKSPKSKLFQVAAHGASFAATIILFLTFNHFGIEFGIVLVPLAIIGRAAYKFHKRRLEHSTRQITESSRIHMATVEALATAIDARDQVGMGHVRRTQIYALGVGKILGLSEDEIRALRTGALLHDIGKLAVPDHILNKPGRLTPAEIEKTKTHASVGASILEKVGFPYPVVPTVKYHHECWDGSGYPEGLQGKNIPLTARILSVADAYDTLRGARPYRPAVSADEAILFLRTGAGKRFDPAIVDVFTRHLATFDEAVRAQGLMYEKEAIDAPEARIEAGTSNYVEQIKRANREVFTLYSLARDFSSSLTPEETLSLFTIKVKDFVPYDTCIVYLLDGSKESATAVHVDGRNEETLERTRIDVGEGATGHVLKRSEPIANVDPSLDFTMANEHLGGQYTSMASIPLIADEMLIGAISLYSSDLPGYQDEHLRLLETLSRIAADAISKSLRHAETESYALTDPMTGLPNARSLQIQFEKEVKRAARAGSSFQLLVLDLDGFKGVNDTFGHKVGDKMLKEIAGVIRGQLRDYDFLSRYGGDEFVAVIPETKDTDVRDLTGRIEEAVNAFSLPVGEGNFARVGVSIGSASYPKHGDAFEQIIISADKAMYMAKAYHKKRRIEQERAADATEAVIVHSIAEVEEQVANGFDLQDGLILELDETHIISSSAVN